ncbi:glycerate kinase [Roseivirga sp.]|uniref:glycerate kinase n=1 Tax=Roseivirga sp. TaxID=1964215 RepID=UPI003B8D086D
MQVLVCPDKFKGSLSADEVCKAIENGIKRYSENIDVVKVPLADGGEGTLDLLENYMSLERVYIDVKDPLFRPISTYYLKNETKAFIEMSKASGLQLLGENEKNPLNTSTFGTGELIKHALDQNVEEVFLLIGGSATNDGGIGMAEALGFKFISENGLCTDLVGSSLIDLRKIDAHEIHQRIKETKFTVLSDVRNVLNGSHGASYVYGEQKGADGKAIEMLDKGLDNLASILASGFELNAGAGAAGGLGYGAMSFLEARMVSGIEAIMDVVDFDDKAKSVDLIITGEGKMDGQTSAGKVVSGVLNYGKMRNIPIGILCGIIDQGKQDFDPKMVKQISDLALNFDDAMTNAAHYLEALAFEMISDVY